MHKKFQPYHIFSLQFIRILIIPGSKDTMTWREPAVNLYSDVGDDVRSGRQIIVSNSWPVIRLGYYILL